MVQQAAEVRRDRGSLIQRIGARALLVFGAVVTFLGVVLVVAAVAEDIAINREVATANAEVVADSFTRTLVRFYTPDGAEHIPQVGVLYPADLNVGDVVQVEYRQGDPELVRVAGRSAVVTLLPVGLTVLGVWAVVIPSVWWLRRRARASI